MILVVNNNFEMINNQSNKIFPYKKIIIVLTIVMVVLICSIAYLLIKEKQTTVPKVSSSKYEKVFFEHNQKKSFAATYISSSSKTIYQASSSGELVVREYLDRIKSVPSYQNIFPENLVDFIKLRLSKSVPDEVNTTHYYYTQYISNTPVFGSSFDVHVRNDNEIYNISSTLLNNTSPIATPSATINFMNIIKNHLGIRTPFPVPVNTLNRTS